MKLLLRAGALALAIFAALPAAAQSTASSVQAPAGYAPMIAPCVKQVDGTCVPVSAANPLPTTGGGGGGGAATIADGADIAEGAVTDATVAAGSAGTVSAKLRRLTTDLAAFATANHTDLIAPLVAGSSIIGKVGIDQSTPGTTNLASISCKVTTSSFATYTNATFNPVTCGAGGTVAIAIGSRTAAADGFANNTVSGWTTTDNSNAIAQVALMCFNATSWDRCRTIQGADGTGIGVSAVALSPNSNANTGVAATVTSAVASSLIGKASAGNLYGLNVVAGASAGFVMIFNATSAPADGAVTPVKCWSIAANSTLDVQWRALPIYFATGITAVFSTTGCFSKTASATAFFSLDAK